MHKMWYSWVKGCFFFLLLCGHWKQVSHQFSYSNISCSEQGYDIIEEMYSSKTAAMNFIHEVCKMRAKAALDAFMVLIVKVMNAYQARYVTPKHDHNFRQTYLPLSCVGVNIEAQIPKRPALRSCHARHVTSRFLIIIIDHPSHLPGQPQSWHM